MRILIVGGSPEASSPETVRAAAADCDVVVAVDRGLDALDAAGIACDLFCGDADSVSPEGAARVRAAQASSPAPASQAPRPARPSFEVERYDPHKDFTDLSLALRAVRSRWGADPAVRCCCLSGGRPDHALAVLGCLARWGGSVELIEDGFEGRVLHAGAFWELGLDLVEARFSFVPLAPGAVVSIAGMRWNLDRAEVGVLSDLGISNVVELAGARVTCHDGVIACWAFPV